MLKLLTLQYILLMERLINYKLIKCVLFCLISITAIAQKDKDEKRNLAGKVILDLTYDSLKYSFNCVIQTARHDTVNIVFKPEALKSYGTELKLLKDSVFIFIVDKSVIVGGMLKTKNIFAYKIHEISERFWESIIDANQKSDWYWP